MSPGDEPLKELTTPALLVALPVLEANVDAAAGLVAGRTCTFGRT